jgi:hypothetical protein
MAVKIIRQPDSFLLVGESRGFQLTVDCSEQLRLSRDKDENLDKEYSRLIRGFEAATDFDSLLKDFNHHFWLHRRPVFKEGQFGPILHEHLAEIQDVPVASKATIDEIYERFEHIRRRFSGMLERKTLPDVSLSKLLHCIRPESYWILDNRVCSVLGFWGYRDTYREFGDFLKDLFNDREFESFKAFLEEENRKTAGDHPSCSFLKLLDTVLWFRP